MSTTDEKIQKQVNKEMSAMAQRVVKDIEAPQPPTPQVELGDVAIKIEDNTHE